MKNYGLNLDLEQQHRSEKDWVYGALSQPCLASIPSGERKKYLPRGEVQKGVDDMMDCASRDPVNLLETKFNFLVRNKRILSENVQWLRDNGYIVIYETEDGPLEAVEFSDAFIAINSGTTRAGNSLIAPIDAIHTCGLIPKKDLPLVATMTFDEYHDPNRITARMINMGKEFLRRFPINYERVNEVHFGDVLKDDMIASAGYAWPDPVDGEYQRTDMIPNHAFLVFDLPKFNIFDNYFDVLDGDFVKKLAADYDLVDFGYRVIISTEKVPQSTGLVKTFWKRVLKYLYEIIR